MRYTHTETCEPTNIQTIRMSIPQSLRLSSCQFVQSVSWATLQTQPELYSEGCPLLRSLLISTNRLALATNNNNKNNDNIQHTILTHNTLPKPHRNVWIGPFIWGCGCYQPGKSLRVYGVECAVNAASYQARLKHVLLIRRM